MYTSFEIENFRCFRKLELPDLARVNLIAGKNNVGKTALLEAVFLHCGGYNPGLTTKIYHFRGFDLAKIQTRNVGEVLWGNLFLDFDATRPLELKGTNAITGERILRLRVLSKPDELARVPTELRPFAEGSDTAPSDEGGESASSASPSVLELEFQGGGQEGRHYALADPRGLILRPLPPAAAMYAIFLAARKQTAFNEDSERFGRLVIKRSEDTVLDILRVIEPRLRRITSAVVGKETILHGDIGLSRLVPLPLLGDGMSRLTSLVLAIADCPGGVVLIDEIENGIHHSAMPRVWQAIDKVSEKFKTQVFATTHSFECIQAAHAAFAEINSYDFRLHRLERTEGTDDIQAVTFDRETMETALEAGWEVR